VKIEGHTLIPLRGVFGTLGCSIIWDDASLTTTVKKGRYTLEFTIGINSFKNIPNLIL
jgi:hypothetical protein